MAGSAVHSALEGDHVDPRLISKGRLAVRPSPREGWMAPVVFALLVATVAAIWIIQGPGASSHHALGPAVALPAPRPAGLTIPHTAVPHPPASAGLAAPKPGPKGTYVFHGTAAVSLSASR